MQPFDVADRNFSVDESESDFDRRRSKRWGAASARYSRNANPSTGRPSDPTSENAEHPEPATPAWHTNFYAASAGDPKTGVHGYVPREGEHTMNLETLAELAGPFFMQKLPAIEQRQQNISDDLAGIQNKTLPSLLLKIEKLQMQVTKQQQQLAFLTGSDDTASSAAPQRSLLFSEMGKNKPHPTRSLQAFFTNGIFRGRAPGQSDISTDIWPRIAMGILSMVYPILVYVIKGATVLIVLVSGIIRSLSLFAPLLEAQGEVKSAQSSSGRRTRNPGAPSTPLRLRRMELLKDQRTDASPAQLAHSDQATDSTTEQPDLHGRAAPVLPPFERRPLDDEDSPQRSSVGSTMSLRRGNSLLRRMQTRHEEER